VYREWAPFVERLATKLGGGAVARGLFAHGRYERGINTLNANYVAVAIE
jgi:hypothetical protein